MSRLSYACDENMVGERMIKFAKELYPCNRSIMGPDIRSGLKKFIEANPSFIPIKYRTGENVFDWEIPKEWIIREAYIEDQSGLKIAEFSKNNLHLVGYSTSIDERISKNDLLKKIHTLPEMPDAIPYVTSYYKKDWGFCLAHNELSKLTEDNYKVYIDSEHKPGELWVLEAVIPGIYKEEIFFSSYLCHPSMANNELSGPVLLNEIVNYVKAIKNRKYTFRFVILPETIGSIAYLSRRTKLLKKNMICGFNLSCVGDERSYSHVKSRLGNNLADKALRAALIGLENVNEYNFLERGSDERQYCAPGIDLPVCTFCRSKFGTYPEYHTSKDDFDLVTSNGLLGSFDVLRNIINSFELGIYPCVQVLGEPQLGKRGLWPTSSKLNRGKQHSKIRIDLLAYCDSVHNIFEIAELIKVDLKTVINELKILNNAGLVDLKDNVSR